MNSKFRAAKAALERLGCRCYVHGDDRGDTFSIDAEDGSWLADYWDNYEAAQIQAVLHPRGLFAEWVNPGRLAVYRI